MQLSVFVQVVGQGVCYYVVDFGVYFLYGVGGDQYWQVMGGNSYQCCQYKN